MKEISTESVLAADQIVRGLLRARFGSEERGIELLGVRKFESCVAYVAHKVQERAYVPQGGAN